LADICHSGLSAAGAQWRRCGPAHYLRKQLRKQFAIALASKVNPPFQIGVPDIVRHVCYRE
jgi:hypothetical protein